MSTEEGPHRSSTGAGKEWWSRRPMAGTYADSGPLAKRQCHKMERQLAKAEIELLRRADEFFDDLERGEDVLGDHLPVDELLARLDDLTS